MAGDTISVEDDDQQGEADPPVMQAGKRSALNRRSASRERAARELALLPGFAKLEPGATYPVEMGGRW
jgi:hypothetical protein